MWQYAQLAVTHDSRLATDSGEWTIIWYGLDSTTESKTRSYGDVQVALNRAGSEDWELIHVAALDAEGSGHTSPGRDWSLTRYTFRRSAPSPRSYPQVSTRVAGTPEGQTRPSSPAMGTDQSARTQPGNAAGPRSTEPVTLVRYAVYCQRDHDPAGTDQHDSDSQLGTGRLFLVREAAHPRNPADIDAIGSLARACEAPGVSSGLREQIRAAAADYAATWVEDQWGTTWWQMPQSFPLSQAAGFLDGSADWLRGLVEEPVADALSVAGLEGPAGPAAGITANLVTARLTAPLEGAALMFEAAGVVVGLAAGAHLLIMACAKRFAHDEANRLLGRGFEQVINSIERSLHARPDSEIERPESAQTEHGASMQTSLGRDAERGNRLTRPGRGHTRRVRADEDEPGISLERREPGSWVPNGRTRRERADEDEPGRDTSRDHGDDIGRGGDR